MKKIFSISKEKLNIIADAIHNVASNKSPDISHCSIKIKVGSKVKFICKNFEAYLCQQHDNNGWQDSEITFIVGANIFCNLIKKLENQEICFFYQNEQIIIADNKSQFTLETLKIIYAERDKCDFQFLCKINCQELSEKIQLCLLKLEDGIFSFNFGEKSYFIARDNRKLALVNLPVQTKEFSINLSADIINELKDVCLLHNNIEIYYTDREVLFQVEDYFLICKNYWTKSINYLDLCRVDSLEVKLNTQELKKTLKKLKLMASTLTNVMDLEFIPDFIRVFVFNPSVGSAQEDIPCDHKILPLKIKLNIVHFLNILQLIKNEYFSLFVIDSKSKIVIREQATYLLMPLSF